MNPALIRMVEEAREKLLILRPSKSTWPQFETWWSEYRQILAKVAPDELPQFERAMRPAWSQEVRVVHLGHSPLDDYGHRPRRDPAQNDQKAENAKAKIEALLNTVIRVANLDVEAGPVPSANISYSRKVFVVHGRHPHMLEAVLNILRTLDFEPIVLAEQANSGKTILEKFESHADVGFAVVLLSGDDKGALIRGKEVPTSGKAERHF